MIISDKLIFDSVENWAAISAKEISIGRLHGADRLGASELMTQVPCQSPAGTAGASTLSIPDSLAKILHIPQPDPTAKHDARVLSIKSKDRVDISDIPTCSTKGIFDKIAKGKFPPHPTITFAQPVDRVHVRVSDRSNQFLWDATFDLKGGTVLNDSSEIVTSESLVPGFIPPCSIKAKSFLNVTIDAEVSNGIPTTFLVNPVGAVETQTVNHIYKQESGPLPVERPSGQRELHTTDAILCKIQKGLTAAKPIAVNVKHKKEEVFLPPKYQHALWRIDRGNEEASDLNPRGLPMHEMVDRSREPPTGLSPEIKELGPVSIGSGQFIPRRPTMNGEISVVQLENAKFAKLFDSRSLEKSPFLADTSVILQRPAGNHQPTVDRTLFSTMWQGIHDKHTPLHPSVEFKHPVAYARLQLVDLEKKRLVWDAVFEAKSNHKIAVDQKPIGGSSPEFKGVSTSLPGKPHWYVLRVDADNPRDSPAHTESPIRYWRQSQFVFGVKRPFVHADALVKVTNKSNFKVGGTQIIKA